MIEPYDMSVWGWVFFREPEEGQQLDPDNPLDWIESGTVLSSENLAYDFGQESAREAADEDAKSREHAESAGRAAESRARAASLEDQNPPPPTADQT